MPVRVKGRSGPAVATHFTDGGRGAAELAEAVGEAAEEPSDFHFLYPDSASLRDQVKAIATGVYGAAGVDYSPLADRQLDSFDRNGLGRFPVCIAKTHLSLSSDPLLTGASTGWRLPVREARANVGAGFVYLICGEMRTMPGLGTAPAATRIDIDADGEVVGLSWPRLATTMRRCRLAHFSMPSPNRCRRRVEVRSAPSPSRWRPG